jgi:hypothetical protein
VNGEGTATGGSIPQSGLDGMTARMGHFRPLLEQAVRPEPGPAGGTAQAWGDWLPIFEGAGIPAEDPRALLHRHDLGERVFASTSVSLVALSTESVRYDFRAVPGSWARI